MSRTKGIDICIFSEVTYNQSDVVIMLLGSNILEDTHIKRTGTKRTASKRTGTKRTAYKTYRI